MFHWYKLCLFVLRVLFSCCCWFLWCCFMWTLIGILTKTLFFLQHVRVCINLNTHWDRTIFFLFSFSIQQLTFHFIQHNEQAQDSLFSRNWENPFPVYYCDYANFILFTIVYLFFLALTEMRFRKKRRKKKWNIEKWDIRGNAFDDENWIYEISQGIDKKKIKTKTENNKWNISVIL